MDVHAQWRQLGDHADSGSGWPVGKSGDRQNDPSEITRPQRRTVAAVRCAFRLVAHTLLLAIFGVVADILTGATAGWGNNVGITLTLFMWPALIVYHFAWIAWHWSKEEQHPRNQT